MFNKVIRLPRVIEAVGLSKSSIYGGVRDGTFPRPVKIGQKAVAWYKEDIEKWLASRERTTNSVG